MRQTKPARLAALFAISIVLMTSALQSATAATMTDSSERRLSLPRGEVKEFGAGSTIPSAPPTVEVMKALNNAFGATLRSGEWGTEQLAALETIAVSKDLRTVWVISDLMRVVTSPKLNALLAAAASELFGVDIDQNNAWGITTDHLIAWDIPAPPDYLTFKRNMFVRIVPEWARIFTEGDID